MESILWITTAAQNSDITNMNMNDLILFNWREKYIESNNIMLQNLIRE